MQNAMLSRPDIDLATDLATDFAMACDQEAIHAPGSIQPHGFLLALAADGRVLQVSDNLPEFVDCDVPDALGQTLKHVIGIAAVQIQAVLERNPPSSRPEYRGSVRLGSGRCFDVLAHRHEGLLMLEFEEVAREGAADFHVLYPLISRFLSRLGDADSVAAMSELAAREIRGVTGFGRVLVVRFDEQGDGEVIAESRDAEYPSFLHQRFPASDIPRQARALYLDSRIRLIPNAHYQPARLVPPLHPLTGAHNDLRFAVLRSVSPVHLQYMRNMGTLATMSISLIIKGKLWGLISCHHATPSFVPFDVRTTCEQLGQILALRIESKEDSDEAHARLELRRLLVEMLSSFTHNPNFVEAARSIAPELLRFGRASGVALLHDDKLVCLGDTPEDTQVRALVEWLAEHARGDLFHTHELSRLYPGGAAIRQHASGILALSLSRMHKHYLIWFRPERMHTIDWAGNPGLKQQADSAPASTALLSALTPRRSFAIWRETVNGCSERWRSSEIDAALEFRTALLGIVLERAEQMAALANELGRVNQELEAFSYSVSHDLRAPLRHIACFCDLLMHAESGNEPAERRQHYLRNIKDSARFAGRLVDDLLGFSHMGRAALRPCRLNMRELLDTCRERLKPEIGPRRIEWDIGPLPDVEADPNLLQLAVSNLLANAIKYTRTRDLARIHVHAEQSAREGEHECEGEQVVFHIEDNGVGFSMEYADKLFGVFQRLHPMEEFDGTGIGLANVRRIIERHGGSVWAYAEPDRGARFSFSLPVSLAVSPSRTS